MCALLQLSPASRINFKLLTSVFLPFFNISPTASYPVPVKLYSDPSKKISFTVISFLVIVPVLSEQITSTDPKVSTALSFLIRACFLAILCVPIAKEIVTTAGNPSGIAATASATDAIKEWISF